MIRLSWSLAQSPVTQSMVDRNLIAFAISRFADHVSGKKILIADIRQPVYRAMAKTMNNETWDQLMKLHKVGYAFQRDLSE